MSHDDIARSEEALLSRLVGRLMRNEIAMLEFCKQAEVIRAWSNERRYFAGLPAQPVDLPTLAASLNDAPEAQAGEIGGRLLETMIHLFNVQALETFGLVTVIAPPPDIVAVS